MLLLTNKTTYQRFAAPMAVATVGGVTMLSPRRTAYAEAPEVRATRWEFRFYCPKTLTLSNPQSTSKKPIYDPYPAASGPTNPSSPSPKAPEQEHRTSSPTPTDRLAKQVGKGRLFLYEKTKSAEQSFDSFWSYVLQKETSASRTIASLAPPKESGEQLLPGAIYVLVATMAGSIVTRNRNILLRATVPVAVGITAGWYLIPITMQNVSDLAWEYEKKVPAVADTHLRIKEQTDYAWSMAKAHSAMVVNRADVKIGEIRESLEDWVKKGK
ncbi:putative mitochondrial protein [Phaeomoniella chlamydospora]|uniref:MICOS complex subunit n=1 Tax=Phaeomoniella chlamydospora TaxID=158046 RepID=A0A0G2H9Z5_PHACM|nr:putative mitochondrial protein [Phaeomoniella chlamydospora]